MAFAIIVSMDVFGAGTGGGARGEIAGASLVSAEGAAGGVIVVRSVVTPDAVVEGGVPDESEGVASPGCWPLASTRSSTLR